MGQNIPSQVRGIRIPPHHRKYSYVTVTTIRLEPSIAPYASGPLQFQVSEHDYQNWQTKRWFNTEEGFVVPKSPYLSNGAPIWVDDGLYDAGLFYVRVTL